MAEHEHEVAWARCLHTGQLPLCGRKGASWNLSWDKRQALQRAIEAEGELLAREIEEAHARALRSEDRPAWTDTENAERKELAAAQSEIAALVAARRNGTCVQALPWFFVHNSNFGDELNMDVGRALLGDQCGGRTRRLLLIQKSQGDLCWNTSKPRLRGSESGLWMTVNAKRRQKILGIGSTLGDVRPGDIVMGVGAKTFRRHAGQSDAPSLSDEAIEALKEPGTHLAALRGPQTCAYLRGRGVAVDCAALAYGDPALIAHILLPWWRHFRWMPARPVGLTPTLCFVPQMSDVSGRHQGFIEAYRSPCRRSQNTTIRLVNPSGSRASPTQFARALQTCDLVLSTALHGVIAADALRVPSVWLQNLTSLRERNLSHYRGNKESPFKYFDYFAGIGKPIGRVDSLEQAIALLHRDPPPQPRLTVSKLLAISRRFVAAFPFRASCRSVAASRAYLAEFYRRRRSRDLGSLVNGSWANGTWTITALNASLANASLLGSADRTAQPLAEVSRSVALTEVPREWQADPVLGNVSDDMPLDAQQNKAGGMAEAFGGAALAMAIGIVAFRLHTSHACRGRPVPA